jgi:hypothetical protein
MMKARGILEAETPKKAIRFGRPKLYKVTFGFPGGGQHSASIAIPVDRSMRTDGSEAALVELAKEIGPSQCPHIDDWMWNYVDGVRPYKHWEYD